MTSEQLDAIRAGSPADLAVMRVSYVINGPCFAWVAEVDRSEAGNFLAGAGVFAHDAPAADAASAVICGVCTRLRECQVRQPDA